MPCQRKLTSVNRSIPTTRPPPDGTMAESNASDPVLVSPASGPLVALTVKTYRIGSAAARLPTARHPSSSTAHKRTGRGNRGVHLAIGALLLTQAISPLREIDD